MKLAIRQRKNSLFYATDYSAYIASMLTSLIATCSRLGVNALEYLVALQEHRPAVFGDRPRGYRGTTTRTWPRLTSFLQSSAIRPAADCHSTAPSASSRADRQELASWGGATR